MHGTVKDISFKNFEKTCPLTSICKRGGEEYDNFKKVMSVTKQLRMNACILNSMVVLQVNQGCLYLQAIFKKHILIRVVLCECSIKFVYS